MKSYDEIVGFDYTSENEWRRWIGERFLPLHKQLSIILKLREELENLLKDGLKGVFSQQSIKEILLGGITKEGEYTPNSLAKLYKDALGIFVNPEEWVTCSRDPNIQPEDYVNCNFESTDFVIFANDMKELIEKIFYKVEIEPQTVEDREVEETINFPEKLLEILKEIYKFVVSVSANYDYHMFFILNTRCIPRFFIEKAYPKLKDKFDKVAEILELEEKFVPNVSDERIRKNYTLIGHKKEGLGDILYQLNYNLWNSLKRSQMEQIFNLVIKNVADLKKEYLEKCEKIISENEYSRRNIWAFYFTKDNDIYLEMYSGNSSNFRNEGSTTLMKLLSEVAPELFLGIKHLVIESEPNCQYERNKVGYVRCIYLRD